MHLGGLPVETDVSCGVWISAARRRGDPATVASLHYPIVDALMKRDAEAAKTAMRVHLEDAWQNVRALFVKQHGAAPAFPAAPSPA